MVEVISSHAAGITTRSRWVINVDYGYGHRVENIEFIDGIFDLVRMANSRDFRIFIVTNQAGIARGYLSEEEEFRQLTTWMCGEFAAAGAPIGHVYFSPFHPTAGVSDYRRDDISQKPRPGMILQAQRELGLDLGTSILSGDQASDIKAGIAAGVGVNILVREEGHPDLVGLRYHVVGTLHEALPFLDGTRERRKSQ